VTPTHAHLRAAIDAELQGVRLRALHDASEALSARYRRGPPHPARALSDLERLAYLAVRMPATAAAVAAVLAQAGDALQRSDVRTLLDLGSGLGAALWAAVDAWPSLEAATLVDADGAMLTLGARVWARHPRARAITTHPQTKRIDAALALPAADIVTLSYVLGELDPPAADAIVRKAFEAARVAVIVVEPGTPAGYRTTIDARTRLLEAGGRMLAPCPHARACPLTGDDWCHFAVRLERSRVHRQLKEAELSWEDEKFACVVIARDAAVERGPAPDAVDDVAGASGGARILRHPRIEKGRIALRLCTPDGLADLAVTRRDSGAWRAARHARWGQVWRPHSREASTEST
jgi:ribosomal protein RSM22 (predicted rRNA methylase)